MTINKNPIGHNRYKNSHSFWITCIEAKTYNVAVNVIQPSTGECELFLGQFTSHIDKNSHLQLPAIYGEYLMDTVYITQGFDRNLLVLTPNAFQEVYECVMALSMTNPLARQLLRLILGNASEVDVTDSSITIPGHLRNLAQLDGEVILIGQGDYFELWAPESWEYQAENLKDVEKNSDRFSMLCISIR